MIPRRKLLRSGRVLGPRARGVRPLYACHCTECSRSRRLCKSRKPSPLAVAELMPFSTLDMFAQAHWTGDWR